MSTSVSFNNSTYTVPATGEEDWGGATEVDGLLIALAGNALSKYGGTFALQTEVDFGGTAGIKALTYKSRGTNVSGAGILRLANAESIGWRNAANSANKELAVDSSDRLTYAGTVIASSAGVVPVAAGGTNLTSYTAGDVLYASGATTLAKLAIGSANQILGVVNAGGSHEYKTVSGTTGQITVTHGANSITLSAPNAVNTKSATYTITNADYLVMASGTFTLTLPDCAGNSGKIYTIINTDSSNTNTITIARAGSDTINGATSVTLKTQNEAIIIMSGGSADWKILDRRIPSIWTAYTPTCAGWSSNTTLTGSWRRVGDSIDVFVKVALAGAPDSAAIDSITLPNSYAIDTTKFSGIATADAILGFASILDNAADYKGVSVMRSTTTFAPRVEVSSATYTTYTDVTQAVPFTFGIGDSIQILMTGIPISNFSG